MQRAVVSCSHLLDLSIAKQHLSLIDLQQYTNRPFCPQWSIDYWQISSIRLALGLSFPLPLYSLSLQLLVCVPPPPVFFFFFRWPLFLLPWGLQVNAWWVMLVVGFLRVWLIQSKPSSSQNLFRDLLLFFPLPQLFIYYWFYLPTWCWKYTSGGQIRQHMTGFHQCLYFLPYTVLVILHVSNP